MKKILEGHIMEIKDEALALEVDPFEGDFGEQSDAVLSNKIVTVRKPRPCSYCGDQINAGDRARHMVGIYDEELISHTFCAECLNLMIALDTTENEDWDVFNEQLCERQWRREQNHD